VPLTQSPNPIQQTVLTHCALAVGALLGPLSIMRRTQLAQGPHWTWVCFTDRPVATPRPGALGPSHSGLSLTTVRDRNNVTRFRVNLLANQGRCTARLP